MTRSIAAITVLVLIGCNDDMAATEGAGAGSSTGDTSGTQSSGTNGNAQQELRAGTRLKVRKLVGDDGAEQQIGFFDTQLNMNCAFTKASDGSMRCLPTTTLQGGTYYIDAGCTQPIVTGCDDGSQYVRVAMNVGCVGGGVVTRVYDRGNAVTMQPFVGTPGNCMQSMFTGTVGEALTVGAEVAPTLFVAATEVVE